MFTSSRSRRSQLSFALDAVAEAKRRDRPDVRTGRRRSGPVGLSALPGPLACELGISHEFLSQLKPRPHSPVHSSSILSPILLYFFKSSQSRSKGRKINSLVRPLSLTHEHNPCKGQADEHESRLTQKFYQTSFAVQISSDVVFHRSNNFTTDDSMCA
ncbi:hypothetical protein EVAR_99246_1 [Eumeta japonica]|uniref:Uncharacterized protein n=1 Tax=Eumeta variegata TaxID=151549 RepID=A0A4C1ZXT0_EUMVA|nr:hypothetical protein EVAR_99246_1 [Eumeta japonica]